MRRVGDEAEDAKGFGAPLQLADRERAAVAGAVDDHARAGFALPVEEVADEAERGARQRHRSHQQHRVDDEHGARIAEEAVEIQNRELARDDADEYAARHHDRVGDAEVAPDAAIDADREERNELRCDDDRQRL